MWARNPDPTAIATGAGLPNAAEIRRNLAGTTSVAQTELRDRLFGYQVLFGVDYALTESVSLGVKGRWSTLIPSVTGSSGTRFAVTGPICAATAVNRCRQDQDQRYRNVRGQRELEVPFLVCTLHRNIVNAPRGLDACGGSLARHVSHDGKHSRATALVPQSSPTSRARLWPTRPAQRPRHPPRMVRFGDAAVLFEGGVGHDRTY